MRTILIALLCVFISSSSLFAQEISLEELARKGARIGRQFKAATEAGDENGQKAALNEIELILGTLKKQEQVDALSNAFNNCNVLISSPSQDALAYTMALGNAIVAGDNIGIEDANDIIETVRQKYLTISSEKHQSFEKYLSIAKEALDLGISALNANGDDNEIARIETQVRGLCDKCSGDKESEKIINELYGIFAIKITDIENDAQICANKIIKALSKDNSQQLLDKALNEVGYYYKKYALHMGEDVAKTLNDKINQKLDGKYNLK